VTIEETIILTLKLREGEDWAFFPDCNTVALSSRLDPEERQAALDRFQTEWRRSMIRVVAS
jgi:hypothetical protein